MGASSSAAAQLRPRADELMAGLMDQVRFNTRKLDAPLLRRILRIYGGQLRYLPGEAPDEDRPTPEPKPIEPALSPVKLAVACAPLQRDRYAIETRDPTEAC